MLGATTLPGAAQQFTTADEVRPILEATRAKWVTLRQFEGKDMLNFTQLVTWRCGLEAVYYSVNGGPEKQLPVEPCYEDEAVPSAIKSTDILPFVSLPAGTVQTVTVRLVYDDGGQSSASFQRADILTS